MQKSIFIQENFHIHARIFLLNSSLSFNVFFQFLLCRILFLFSATCWGCSSFVASRQLSSGPVPQKELILE